MTLSDEAEDDLDGELLPQPKTKSPAAATLADARKQAEKQSQARRQEEKQAEARKSPEKA